MESFFKTLKYEEKVHLCDYEICEYGTFEDVIVRLPSIINEVYLPNGFDKLVLIRRIMDYFARYS